MPAIYTRTGDRGETGLFGGTRVSKQDPRVEAYGTVDEANASLGLAKSGLEPGEWRERVHQIQHRLFVLGAELASGASNNPLMAGFAVILGLMVWFKLVMQWLLLTTAWIAVGPRSDRQ